VRYRLWLLVSGLLLVAATLAACSSGSAAPEAPLLYTNPHNPLVAVAATWDNAGRHADAKALRALAAIPQAVWAAGQAGDIRAIHDYSMGATQAHRIGVVVAYNLPHRDACGKYSSNDETANRAYRIWVDQLAAAIGASRDIVIVEPNAVPDIVTGCLGKSQVISRYQLLRYAMQKLSRLPHTQVYLDAGNSGMATPSKMAGFMRALAKSLVRAGVYFGKGFSANVSNFQQTDVSVQWSRWLASMLGHGMRTVVDTSRNGKGPYVGRLPGPDWCNPPGRAPGVLPTLDTGQAGISGYLWIKDTGVSDGACNGGLAAGKLLPGYALDLARQLARTA
jgi:endoglucanase